MRYLFTCRVLKNAEILQNIRMMETVFVCKCIFAPVLQCKQFSSLTSGQRSLARPLVYDTENFHFL